MYKLPENLDSKYRFVTLASKRAEQLQTGARPKVEDTDRKVTVMAQEEVATGLVDVWDGQDAEPSADAADEEEV